MKTKDVKYLEAVIRHLNDAKKYKTFYIGMPITAAKQKLSIRKSDNSFDDQIQELIKKENKK